MVNYPIMTKAKALDSKTAAKSFGLQKTQLAKTKALVRKTG
jgi:prolyl-tRNA editing enzyme YbaK/EbsC (Cys-tRNA(Pro) deacylase)